MESSHEVYRENMSRVISKLTAASRHVSSSEQESAAAQGNDMNMSSRPPECGPELRPSENCDCRKCAVAIRDHYRSMLLRNVPTHGEPMSNSTVISMLNRFADVFDVGRLDAETIHTMAKWWERALSDLSDSQVEEAAELVIAHRLNRTFPLPAHVLEAAEIIRQVRVIIRKS